MHRSVFHIRLKNFELQAERIMDATLRTRPVAVLSSQQQNGTIIALSKEAREEGLSRGMRLSQARKMSHSALLLPYNQSLYTRLNHYLYTAISRFTPIVEPAGFGHFFLDMSGMGRIYPDFKQAGSALIRIISDRTSMESLIGISTNKLVSSISTSVIPETIYQVFFGDEPHFLSPLHSPVLPIVQFPSVKKLVRFLFLNHIGDIQKVTEQPVDARALFGEHAWRLSREARGEDTAAVRPPTLRDHLVEQIILPEDTNDEDTLRAIVRSLAEQVAFQLRKRRQLARHVKLEIHYTDGMKNARTGTLSGNTDATVVRVCQQLFSLANYRRNRIRTVVLDVTHFTPWAPQTNLFPTAEMKRSALSQALDRIRLKHGFQSIHSAAALSIIGSP
jgi:DNA polymerase-4